MRYDDMKKMLKGIVMALLAIILTAGPSLAQSTYDLCASDGTITMPDTTVIPIWGFVDITGGGPCTAGMANTLPGPVLTAADGETLTINLFNALGVPVSVFIPGMAKDAADPLAPQADTDGQGRERLTSFDKMVAAGGSDSYLWTAKEGTYLYHSAADVRTQVPMGLYGALVVSGTTYPVVAQEEVLVFSEIDPALNDAPGTFGGARVSNWVPQYFLINGAAYDPASLPIPVDVSADVLLRFVNAGLATFAPTFGGGLYMDVIAEDGNLYPYPLKQYGLELTAGKTMDAVINAGTVGTYTLYDRSLHLANGGMVTAIEAVAAVDAPTAVNDGYSVAEDDTLTADGVVPNPDGVLANDTGGAAAAVLVSGPSAGVLAGGLAADGTFTYTPDPDFSGSDAFTYVANDGLGGPNSNTATVSITVTPVNDPPTANPDAYNAPEGQVLNVAAPGVLTNDVDVDGDMLVVTTTPVTAPINGTLTLNADGSFDYTPLAAAPAVDSFTYAVCDAQPLCADAVVAINVTAVPNVAPTAVEDTAEVLSYRGNDIPTSVTFNITANDVDPDGTIDAASVVITTGPTTQRGGTVTSNGDGTVTFVPRKGFRGTDTFSYTVNDNDGESSNPATVRVNVL